MVGDANYGVGVLNRLFRDRFGLRRLALHAWSLSFRHPVTGALVEPRAPVPEDLAVPLRTMGVEIGALAADLRASLPWEERSLALRER